MLARLRRALRGSPPPGAGAPPQPPTPRRPDESLLRCVARGKRLDDAVLAEVRALVGAGRHDRARSIATSLSSHADTVLLGRLAGGIVAFRRGYPALAYAELAGTPRALWAAHAPREYLRSGLAVAPEETLREVRRVVAENPAEVGARSWYEILGPLHGFGAAGLAREVFAVFDRRLGEDRSWPDGERRRDWMRPWVAADPGARTAPPPPDGRPVFAVIDYGHPGPDRGSANIGDHIQSIAALGHLVRHRRVRLHGARELVGLLEDLRERTRPERRREDVEADLEVVTAHRDASMYEAFAPGTWVLCFGWFMHALFGMRHGFPLHEQLRPIFVSFHCNKRALLTPQAIAYLKRYGPVGCRDWTTVHLLQSIGVPAFFSGCVTTTIDTVFPDLVGGPRAGAPPASVDMPSEDVPPGAVTYKHSSPEVRARPFVANVRVALDRLETYRSQHSEVLTSRLHCYLPLRAMGANVTFRPRNPADVRYDGLVGISQPEFDAIRDGLLAKLDAIFTAIVAGRSEADVYALWRELNAADVASADERRRRPGELPAARDLGERLDRVVSRTVTRGQAAGAPAGGHVDCAVIAGKGDGRSVSVLTASLLAHASRPLHLWVLALPGCGAVDRRLAERHPELRVSRVPLRGLARGLRTASGAPVGAETVSRLLLAHVLPGVGRLVLLPLPSIATADVSELADLDLGDQAIAAPRRPGTSVSGFGVIFAAADRLGEHREAAAELRRTALARHAFDFDAFTADVLVLDLELMRANALGRCALPLVQAFGLDHLEALHYLLGPDRATVEERWATVPTRMPARGAGLIHWADGVKPWQAELTPERDHWRTYAAMLPNPARPAAAPTSAPPRRG